LVIVANPGVTRPFKDLNSIQHETDMLKSGSHTPKYKHKHKHNNFNRMKPMGSIHRNVKE